MNRPGQRQRTKPAILDSPVHPRTPEFPVSSAVHNLIWFLAGWLSLAVLLAIAWIARHLSKRRYGE
jgi:hypothetical protein